MDSISIDTELKKRLRPAIKLSDIAIADLKVNVLETGFPSFDNSLVFKANRSELIVLGARPGHGKSALMFQIARNVSRTKPVLIFSLEMDKEAILTRLIASEFNKTVSGIQRGNYLDTDLLKHRNSINSDNFHIIEKGTVSANEIMRIAKEYAPLSLIIVDYLQIISSTDKETYTRDNEIGEMTGKLKQIAKEFKCPVLVGSQLSRAMFGRGKVKNSNGEEYFKPMLSDLRESGNIEADADVVLLLNRFKPERAEIEIAKNRNGISGAFEFEYISPHTKFIDREGLLL